MSEPIVVVLQTYRRTDCALRTIEAACTYLRYSPLKWYVADDGSPSEHWQAVNDALQARGADVLGGHSFRQGYGKNANDAWYACDAYSNLTFWLEDDWELRQPLELYPYACLLMETSEIGMVRLGVLNMDVRARTWAHGGLVYWKMDREPHIEGTPVFTGHPALRHRRYRDTYGWYPEGLLPGETELAYAWRFRKGAPNDPGIVWPADYPCQGYFGHIGTIKTETMV